MKKWIILLIILFIPCAIAFHFLNRQAPKTLTADERKKAIAGIAGGSYRDDAPVVTGTHVYKNDYFTLTYPARATIYMYAKEHNTNPTVLDIFQIQEQSKGAFLSVEVRNLSGVTDFSSVPDVIVRRQQGSYTEAKQTVAGTQALVFTKDTVDGFEKSIFMLRGGKFFAFAATGRAASDDLLTPVISSLHFLN